MTPPTAIKTLSSQDAVADALHRAVLGLDTNDHALFESSCLGNDSITLVYGPNNITGWESFSATMAPAFKLITTHFITNVRVAFADDDETAGKASMSASALAYHVRPDDALKVEDTSYTAGCLYFLDLVKDEKDGLWKIEKWEIRVQWTTGDRGVLHG